MPTHRLTDDTPVVEFDPRLEVSPFALFRRLTSSADLPLLVDVRQMAGISTLRGAQRLPSPAWTPPVDRDTVLFDEDGNAAVALARDLQAAGHQ